MGLKETNKIDTNRYQLEILIEGEKFREALKEAYRKNGKKLPFPASEKVKHRCTLLKPTMVRKSFLKMH